MTNLKGANFNTIMQCTMTYLIGPSFFFCQGFLYQSLQAPRRQGIIATASIEGKTSIDIPISELKPNLSLFQNAYATDITPFLSNSCWPTRKKLIGGLGNCRIW